MKPDISGESMQHAPDIAVRAATPDDLPEMTEMGRRFFAQSSLAKFAEFDVPSFETAMTEFMATEHVSVVAHDAHMAGMACALAYPAWYNSAHVTAQELFWWVEPQYRGWSPAGRLLLDRMEQWAKGRGAETFSMGATETLRPEALEAFYRRRGYAPLERLFTKRL